MADIARIDKWLWAARIFKTRSIAADACKNGRVTIKGINVKPSHTIKAGEVVSVKKPPITYSFEVLQTIEKRVGAKLVPEVYKNVTDAKQYELLEMSRISGFVDRARGTGRPTKKDRRQLDAFVDPTLFGFDDFDDDEE
ncbi:RNA-binding S4 domain-containing protein [Prevotella intermedia]|jgi:S4 domain protein|uniref:Heat-shock protein Hsp15 n=1 Tax=Prevotella intermedia TaxID=28131 RepID=A0A0H5B2D1_PREIN|nr:RNA-binding S4 domain-containing protein [Prevotella intermedia]AFJ08792.1 S4 domain protein [Prevotella intermedia 17]APW34089.1 heat-shock protein Hsp15 [Prevotella intermedia]ATV25853.1 RNA-binding S4 domain-containing protein [Prevotella intermedia]ATV31488.1 RNA-binding S4 domain-containing protein [Prevotella intermedia]ATV37171.1 RNA-binding S4 domain-containing protein [Prevotella intermedia]